MIEDFNNVAFGQIVTMIVSEHFLYTKPNVGQRFVLMLRESSNFSEESVKKSWGKESDNESGLEFIPCFDSSFVEFVQLCFCFPNSEEFVNVFMRIGFGSSINWFPLTSVKWLPLVANSLVVSGIVIAEPGVEATT
ncbi:hypothetical protein Tco_0908291 [Tanacetum coccineum]|uniref:Uncharacterized protein n=1 Tax=Tanacetum coccineum TaxID=301880 RepID=A0ABQ5CLR1_9ASTR